MAWTELNNTDSIEDVFNFPNIDSGDLFYPMFLFVVFIVFASYTYYRDVEKNGMDANIFGNLAVGGFVTTAIATAFSVFGVVSSALVITSMVVSLVFMVIFMLTK